MENIGIRICMEEHLNCLRVTIATGNEEGRLGPSFGVYLHQRVSQKELDNLYSFLLDCPS
jgi:hypothetical protein